MGGPIVLSRRSHCPAPTVPLSWPGGPIVPARPSHCPAPVPLSRPVPPRRSHVPPQRSHCPAPAVPLSRPSGPIVLAQQSHCPGPAVPWSRPGGPIVPAWRSHCPGPAVPLSRPHGPIVPPRRSQPSWRRQAGNPFYIERLKDGECSVEWKGFIIGATAPLPVEIFLLAPAHPVIINWSGVLCNYPHAMPPPVPCAPLCPAPPPCRDLLIINY